MKLYTLIILFALALWSCNNQYHSPGSCPQTVHCKKETTGLKYEGYTGEQTDTVIITSYTKDGDFQQVQSIHVYTVLSDPPALTADYDYDIYIPKAAKHHRISDIIQPDDSSFIYTMCAGSGKLPPAPKCSYAAQSASVDGESSKPVSSIGAPYCFVLKKQ